MSVLLEQERQEAAGLIGVRSRPALAVWRRFRQNPLAVVSLTLLALIALLALVYPLVSPYSYTHPTGDISAPFQTQFGWHLVQVLERRTEDMSQDRVRLAARQAIRERKADEAYQEWLRQLRDRAFVEIRLEDR